MMMRHPDVMAGAGSGLRFPRHSRSDTSAGPVTRSACLAQLP